ncbi:hypothetical protein Back2_22990 [Nocardioides baekrokdamisoli]|uniref:Uncharacterized protein n=1 Tax=Nocardioides baekrokdamisoli TaxID=1804624 RepID=A0A3G9IIM5_9ACTN|nr:hypothetical protein Back2_22990 [Nocardioides baekrokdamisoli]
MATVIAVTVSSQTHSGQRPDNRVPQVTATNEMARLILGRYVVDVPVAWHVAVSACGANSSAGGVIVRSADHCDSEPFVPRVRPSGTEFKRLGGRAVDLSEPIIIENQTVYEVSVPDARFVVVVHATDASVARAIASSLRLRDQS